MSSPVWMLMGNEWQRQWHARTPLLLLLVLIIIWAVSLFAAHHHWQDHARNLARVADQSQQDWQSQPDRHPHRVSHYGDFVVKPIHPLSFIEPGILDQSGYLLYLEGHRLNSANFNPAIEATSLGRFPVVTPAMIVQWWMPLFLIMIGYACITEEKSAGILAYVRGNGTPAWHIALGKWLALFLPFIALLLLQALLSVFLIWGSNQGLTRLGLMLLTQVGYIAGWCTVVIVVSWYSKRPHIALLTLLLCWVCITIILPKGLANIAQISYPTMPRIEAEYHAEHKLKDIGDSHNPNDPHFNAFKQSLLKQYGVSKTEDLPVNYNGLLMQEAETLTTQVYREQQGLHEAQLIQQNAFIRQWLWLTPALALQYVQMACSGNDLPHHLSFLKQAEDRRYQLIRYLNQVHIDHISQHDDKNIRVSADFWKNAPRQPMTLAALKVSESALKSGIWVLIGWLMLPALLLLSVMHRT